MIVNRICNVSLTTLKSSPYSLVRGDSIYAKIVAVNIYGESQQSTAGNGALIQSVPDSPINLVNDASSTTGYLIKFTWTEGISNGGSKVIDYNIYYD